MTIGALPPAGLLPAATVPVVPPASGAGRGPAALTGGQAPGGPRGAAPDAATRAATSFERILLEQLTTQLTATAAPDDDEASAATSAYRDLLPRAMADGLAAAGGIGIAAALAPAAAPMSSGHRAPAVVPPPPTGIPS